MGQNARWFDPLLFLLFHRSIHRAWNWAVCLFPSRGMAVKINYRPILEATAGVWVGQQLTMACFHGVGYVRSKEEAKKGKGCPWKLFFSENVCFSPLIWWLVAKSVMNSNRQMVPSITCEAVFESTCTFPNNLQGQLLRWFLIITILHARLARFPIFYIYL